MSYVPQCGHSATTQNDRVLGHPPQRIHDISVFVIVWQTESNTSSTTKIAADVINRHSMTG